MPDPPSSFVGMRSMRHAIAALLAAALLLSLTACEAERTVVDPAATPTARNVALLVTPTPSPSPTPVPSPTPTAVIVPTPTKRSLSVAALLTSAPGAGYAEEVRWGIQQATLELGVEALVLDDAPRGDLAKMAYRLAEAGYDLVVVEGVAPDTVAWVASLHPTTKFVTFGKLPDPSPPNVVGMVFAEDEAGFLAGALAGWLTERDMVAFVGAAPTVEIVRFRKGYERGVEYVNSQAIVLGAYLESFTDADAGRAEAHAQIDEGADVLFAAGGTTARGAMEAAAARGVPVLAAGADPFGAAASPVREIIISTALVRADFAVYEVIRSAALGSFQGGTRRFDIKSGAVGLGPYREWENRIPEAARKHVESVIEGLREGRIKTNVRT